MRISERDSLMLRVMPNLFVFVDAVQLKKLLLQNTSNFIAKKISVVWVMEETM
jgi:hypothetical protein